MAGLDQMATTGRLAERVNAWPRPFVCASIAAAAIVLVTIDRIFPAVGMGPIYIPLIALAGWRLGLGASCLVAVAAALLNIFPLHVQDVGIPAAAMIARGILRFSTYVFIVAVVYGFRQAYDRQRFMARRDLMTGVVNRTTFEQHTDHLLTSTTARHETLLLATIDLDDFKRINDTHGHAAGDAALCAFADAAQSLLRASDCLGRIGGDEFALAMIVRSIEDGRAAAEQLHRRLSDRLRSTDYPVTISMGALVVAPDRRLDRVELMREVDRAMYRAKARGKGSVQTRTIVSAALEDANPRNVIATAA